MANLPPDIPRPKTLEEFMALPLYTGERLLALGCAYSTLYDVYLFPVEWYPDIPDGYPMLSITGESFDFDRTIHTPDSFDIYGMSHGMKDRAGFLAYGVPLLSDEDRAKYNIPQHIGRN